MQCSGRFEVTSIVGGGRPSSGVIGQAKVGSLMKQKNTLLAPKQHPVIFTTALKTSSRGDETKKAKSGVIDETQRVMKDPTLGISRGKNPKPTISDETKGLPQVKQLGYSDQDIEIILLLTKKHMYQAQISRKLKIGKSTLSRKIKSYEKDKLITRIGRKSEKGKKGVISIYKANPAYFPKVLGKRMKLECDHVDVKLEVVGGIENFKRLRAHSPVLPNQDKNTKNWDTKELVDMDTFSYGWKKFEHPDFRILMTTKSFIFHPLGHARTKDATPEAKEEAERIAVRDAKENALELRSLLEKKYGVVLDFNFLHTKREPHFKPVFDQYPERNSTTFEGRGMYGGSIAGHVVATCNEVPVISDKVSTISDKIDCLEQELTQVKKHPGPIEKARLDSLENKISNIAQNQDKIIGVMEHLIAVTSSMDQNMKSFVDLFKKPNNENIEEAKQNTKEKPDGGIYT